MLPALGIGGWKRETFSVLAAKILDININPLVLVDGKGGSGKTSFAVKLAGVLGANIVRTDDLAWRADPIHWDGELLSGIIQPWLDGKNASFKPSDWIKKNRIGFIEIDSSKALIIEGCGACRKTLRKFASYSIWIDTEPELCRARVIQRDLANGENGGTLESVTEFTNWRDSVVDPFLVKEESWKHTNIIVSGSKSDFGSNIFYAENAI